MATLLAIELHDELSFSAEAAAWPAIRGELGLDYTQVGLLIAVPIAVGNLVEPLIGILGDVASRRALVRAGGIGVTLALVLTALSPGFAPLLAALVLCNPAAGAFVGLAQATLVDLDPGRREQNLARWALAGSLGQVGGATLIALGAWAGVSWRVVLLLMAGLAASLVAASWRHDFPAPRAHEWHQRGPAALLDGAREALAALRRPAVLRWLVLLQFSDLMLDVLFGFLALYFVDVAGVTGARAALAVTAWTGVGVVGDALLLPLLERVPGVRYLRVSALLTAITFAAFLLVPGAVPKVALVATLGLLNSGWYAILKAGLYSAVPGRSASVMSIENVAGLVGSLIPLGIGLAAERAGLAPTMWLLLLGPVALFVGLPRARRT